MMITILHQILNLYGKNNSAELLNEIYSKLFGQGYISQKETSTKGIYKFPSAHYWILSKNKLMIPKDIGSLSIKKTSK